MSHRPAGTPWFARLALLTGLALVPALAQAQSALPNPPIPDRPSTAPKLSEPGQLDRAPETVPQEGGSGATLGGALSRSEGVISPAQPGIDPGMAQAPPSTGPNSTPVITPPATAGSDTKVTPK
jgi:hypothetical protein